MTTLRNLAVGAGLVVALVAATGATDAGAVSFQSPSGNVGCQGDARGVRCDVRRTTGSIPPKPRTCRLDWGHAFAVNRTGRGHVVCAGDTALHPNARVLAYGRTISVNPRVRCTSRHTGMTCINRQGHGFTLSRERVRLF